MCERVNRKVSKGVRERVRDKVSERVYEKEREWLIGRVSEE